MSRWWTGAVLLVAATASAQEPVAAVLPAGALQGDGVTSHVVHLLVVDGSGAPSAGAKLKLKASAGELGRVRELGGGLYAADWIPPVVETTAQVTLTLTGKTSEKQAVSAERTWTVGPGARAAVTASANPDSLTLGRVEQATLSLEVVDANARPVTGAAFAVQTNFGEVSALTDMGGGRYTARYDATNANFPHVELLTVADWTDPANVSGFAAIPVNGSVNYPVDAPAGSTVVLRIGEREFGPSVAGADGKALVPVVVPPGTSKATSVVIQDGNSVETVIDLRVPETLQLGWFPVPVGVPADPSRPVSLRVAAVTAAGEPDESAQLTFAASVGKIGESVPEGNGVYRVMYVPPLLTTPGSATLKVSVAGSQTQVDGIELPLLPARPASIKVVSDPSTLEEGATAASLSIALVDPTGAPMADQMLRVVGSKVSVDGLATAADNSWTAKLTVPGDGAVDVVAAAPGLPMGNPLTAVVLLPDAGGLGLNGATTGLSVLTVDAFGFPVPDVAVALTVDGGGLEVDDEVRTDAQGFARATLTGGDDVGVFTITGKAAASVGQAAVLQTANPGGLAVLPVSGHSADLRLRSSVQAVVVSTRLRGPGAAAVTAAAQGPVPEVEQPPPAEKAPAAAVVAAQVVEATLPAEVDPEGAVARLDLVISPEPSSPGSDANVTVVAWSGSDKGVPGLSLVLMPEAGKATELVDQGNGAYTAVWSIPKKATGALRLTAATSEGAVSKIVSAELQSMASAKKDKPPREPREATGDQPWLRAQVGLLGSSYRYLQVPATSNGPLLPQAFAIGGEYGKNAVPGGLSASGEAFAPGLTYVGAHVSVDAARTQVTMDRFDEEVVTDWLLDLQAHAVGRYPFEVAGNHFHVGARAGFRLNDLMVWEGNLDDDTLAWRTLMLPSLDVGLEAAVTVGRFHGLAAIDQAFAFGTTPATTSVDVGVGFDITGPLSVEAGFSHRVRDVELVGASTDANYGSLSDAWTVGRIGAGVAF